MKKILVAFLGAVVVSALAAAPVKAGTLEQDAAWVQAQAEAGLKAGQAALDAAKATCEIAAADRDAKAAAAYCRTGSGCGAGLPG